MEKVNLRRINEWDAPAMLKIYAPYVEAGACIPESTAPTLPEYITRIDKYTYGRGWIMCEIAGVPAGICHIRETEAEPDNGFVSDIEIYVKPEFKRRHVGTALFAFMRDIMEHGNRKKVFADIFADNEEGMAFYESLGFTLCGAGRDVRGRATVRMCRELSPKKPEAETPTKPYLINNHDYERVRELAQEIVIRKI